MTLANEEIQSINGCARASDQIGIRNKWIQYTDQINFIIVIFREVMLRMHPLLTPSHSESDLEALQRMVFLLQHALIECLAKFRPSQSLNIMKIYLMMAAVEQLRSRPLGMVGIHETMQKEIGTALGQVLNKPSALPEAIIRTNNCRIEKLENLCNQQRNNHGHSDANIRRSSRISEHSLQQQISRTGVKFSYLIASQVPGIDVFNGMQLWNSCDEAFH